MFLFLKATVANFSAVARRVVVMPVLVLCLGGGASLAMALPEAVEMDRLMMAAEKHLQERQFDEVAKYLEKMDQLSIKPPAPYYYCKAEVARSEGKRSDERQALEPTVLRRRTFRRQRLSAWLQTAYRPALGLSAGLGLSANFWIPMMLERQYVRVDQWFDGRYDFRGHFKQGCHVFSSFSNDS